MTLRATYNTCIHAREVAAHKQLTQLYCQLLVSQVLSSLSPKQGQKPNWSAINVHPFLKKPGYREVKTEKEDESPWKLRCDQHNSRSHSDCHASGFSQTCMLKRKSHKDFIFSLVLFQSNVIQYSCMFFCFVYLVPESSCLSFYTAAIFLRHYRKQRLSILSVNAVRARTKTSARSPSSL